MLDAAAASLILVAGPRLLAIEGPDPSDEVVTEVLRATYVEQAKPWTKKDLNLAVLVATELGPVAAHTKAKDEYPPDIAAEAAEAYRDACIKAQDFLDLAPYMELVRPRLNVYQFGRFNGLVEAFLVYDQHMVITAPPSRESIEAVNRALEQHRLEEEQIRAMGLDPDDPFS